MKNKLLHLPAIVLGLLGITTTYIIDSSQNRQWQSKVRENYRNAAETVKAETKRLFCKNWMIMETIVSELASVKKQEIIGKYANEMKPWNPILIEKGSLLEVDGVSDSFLEEVRNDPSGKALTAKRTGDNVDRLYMARLVERTGEVLLAYISPRDMLSDSCFDILSKYHLGLFAIDLFGEKEEIPLTGNKNIQESFQITFPVMMHKQTLALKLALKEGKGPVPPNRIGIWVSGLGITLLLISFLTVLRKKNIVLEESKQVIEEDKRKLHELSIRDPLTDIFNRRHFEKLLHSEFRRAKRYSFPLSCIMLDIDHFKNFNDTYGHQFGDEVLKEVAGLLKNLTREIDIVARYGGEEFIVILPETDAEGALTLAERIRSRLAGKQYACKEKKLTITVSLGVSTMKPDSEGITDEQKLVFQADQALYQAKGAGRNRVYHFAVKEVKCMGKLYEDINHVVKDLEHIHADIEHLESHLREHPECKVAPEIGSHVQDMDNHLHDVLSHMHHIEAEHDLKKEG